MTKVFKLPKKAIPKPDPGAKLKAELKKQLDDYERLCVEETEFLQQYEAVFKRQKEIADRKEDVAKTVKVLVHSTNGPPPGITLKGASFNAANGSYYRLRVTYSRHAPYYEPKELPADLFRLHPEIVVQVDTDAIDALPGAEAYAVAKKEGRYKAPSASFVRLSEDSDG